MGTLFLCSRELVKKQGRGYKFTISENDSTILLFGIGRDYKFTENDGVGIWSLDTAIIFFIQEAL